MKHIHIEHYAFVQLAVARFGSPVDIDEQSEAPALYRVVAKTIQHLLCSTIE